MFKKKEPTLEEMKERKETLRMLRWMILKEKPKRKGLDFIVPEEERKMKRKIKGKNKKARLSKKQSARKTSRETRKGMDFIVE